MAGLIWKLYWKLSRWTIKGRFPYQYKKLVLVVAPHTSWKDVLIGFAARNHLKIYHAKFLGKKELFNGPFGFLFRWLGGTPVDRTSKRGMVEQVTQLFAQHDHFLLAMAPEGTRKKVDKLRSGFYHIAKQAQVPIMLIGLDFEHKELVLGEPLFTSDNEAADFTTIINFFANIKGANPAYDLRHLKNETVS